METQVRFAVAAVALTLLAVGCSTEDVARSTAALNAPTHLTITLPNGVGLHELALVAADSLEISPSASIISPPASFASIANTGTTDTSLAAKATVGNVYSQAAVTLKPGAEVHGSIKSASTVSIGPNAVVTGSVAEGAVLTPFQNLSWSVTFPSSQGDVVVAQGQTRTLPVGGYGDLHVYPNATLHLSSGSYFFNSMVVEPHATVVADTQAGPVIVYVASTLTLRSAVDAGGA